MTIVGVNPDASLEEIRKAYKKRAIKYHPDKYKPKDNADKDKAKTAFQKIATSVEVLSDPTQRSRYDRELRERGQGGVKTSDFGSSSRGSSSSSSTTFTPPPPDDRTYRSLYTFLSQINEEVKRNPDADVSEAFPLILQGCMHVSLEIIAFIGVQAPWLLVTLGLAGGAFFFFASQSDREHVWQQLQWDSLHPSVRGALLDVLVLFYRQKASEEERAGRRQPSGRF
eukprot:gene29304-35377_t